MKLPEKKKVKNPKLNKRAIIKPKKEKVLVVAQEFKFARLLSGNEKKTRDRVLKTLKKWLLNCFEKGYEFKDDDFIRVWKGLFYAVWMSDKPLVQEELCDSISEILDLFPSEQIDHAIMMVKAGFRVLATEWYGLDHHRMDKFLMLVRRYLRGAWRCLHRAEWSLHSCERFSDMLTGTDGVFAVKTPSFARNSLSLMLHITDCYLEELSKVSQGVIPPDSLAALLRPFTLHVRCDTPLGVPARRLLTHLMRQSDLGLEYEDRTRAWQRMGCPPGGPEAMELDEDDEEEKDAEEEEGDGEDDEPGALDPRAGRVSVLLRPLPVPAARLAALLRAPARTHAARRRADTCALRFEALASSRYPLPLPAGDIPEPRTKGVSPGRAARGLAALERKLVETTDELTLKAMNKRHRKKLLAKARAGLSIVEEVSTDATVSSAANGEWQVEETEANTTDSNKENIKKKKKNKKRKSKSEESDLGNKRQKISENGVKAETKKQKDSGIDKKRDNNEAKKMKQSKMKLDTDKENEVKVNEVAGDNLTNGDKKHKTNKNKLVSNTSHINKKDNNKTNVEKNPENKGAVSKESKIEKIINVIKNNKNKKTDKVDIKENAQKNTKFVASKVKNFQKQTKQANSDSPKKKMTLETPKKVKFVLKNNSMQGPVDYYKSVRQSPSIPYDGLRQPSKTNLKPSTPSPVNPFFKKKFKLKLT